MYDKHSKIRTLLFLFSNKILVFRAGINKILVRIANREDLDQTASTDVGLEFLAEKRMVEQLLKKKMCLSFLHSALDLTSIIHHL